MTIESHAGNRILRSEDDDDDPDDFPTIERTLSCSKTRANNYKIKAVVWSRTEGSSRTTRGEWHHTQPHREAS